MDFAHCKGVGHVTELPWKRGSAVTIFLLLGTDHNRKVMGGMGKKPKKKFMQGKMPRKKIRAKKKGKKKNSCRRKIQL